MGQRSWIQFKFAKKRFNSRTDGWKPQTFHQKCDNKGKSIILIKLQNKSLFGEFAAMGWDSNSRDKQSRGNKSFLFSFFSLDPNFKEPLKMPVYQNKENEIYCHSYFGLGFGNDLELGYDNLNMNEYCSSYLDYTYKAPFGYEYDLKQARNFLAGSCDN